MKKYLPYLFAGLVVVAVLVLFFTGSNSRRTLDERLSFRKRDKIPYGAFVAYENLKYLFPKASIITSRDEPGYWDSVSMYGDKQAVIILSPQFNADKYEMKNLVRFAESGNDVFISTMDIPYDVTHMLHCSVNASEHFISFLSNGVEPDTLTVSLSDPPFGKKSFTYPGKQYDGYFSKIDTNTTTVLGNDRNQRPNFIHLKAGKGNVYVHLAPMVFTNYFLLHKNNIACYENMLSLISSGTTRVVWDEYFLYKPNESKRNNSKKNWLAAILSTENSAGRKPFAAAFWLLMATLLIFVLQEMRRKQRYIPVIKAPRNDSLDFVKTIGRLYHDKGDHRNLCRKMTAYFLEHVRSRYKLATTKLDEDFVRDLHFKTGVEEAEINSIVSSIKHMDNAFSVSETEMTAFHKQLESFYKKA